MGFLCSDMFDNKLEHSLSKSKIKYHKNKYKLKVSLSLFKKRGKKNHWAFFLCYVCNVLIPEEPHNIFFKKKSCLSCLTLIYILYYFLSNFKHLGYFVSFSRIILWRRKHVDLFYISFCKISPCSQKYISQCLSLFQAQILNINWISILGTSNNENFQLALSSWARMKSSLFHGEELRTQIRHLF